MKPNDKAYQAAIAEGKRWGKNLIRKENQIPSWKVLRQSDKQYGYDVIAGFNNHEDCDEALERLRAEAMVDAAYAAQFKSEDYAGLVKQLRFIDEDTLNIEPYSCEQLCKSAADALEAVLAERDALMAVNAEFSVVFRERDDAIAIRDALAARLAPVEPIESDKDDPTREYIPLPGGWEIQTKGKGSSYRLLDKKTGERHMILAGDAQFVHDFVTRMAKEINASAQVHHVAPVDDKALVEIVAVYCSPEMNWNEMSEKWKNSCRRDARAAIAAIRPHIEAAERERCAKIAESHKYPMKTIAGTGYNNSAKEIAAAIRRGK